MAEKEQEQEVQSVANESTQDQNAQASENEAAAKIIVSKYTGWGAGAGVLPIPLWDIVAVGGVQVLMLKELYQQYGVTFNEKKARSTVSVLLGSLSPALLLGITASTLLKFVPGVGSTLAMASLPILASASTYAVGKIMIKHLEQGGTLEDFDAKEHKEEFNESVESAKENASKAKKSAKATTA
ncbi:MAG: DUF697 domain-containing protein [Algicola sp.]|nr:DUF697 domain-containing protein [Algicola sp.]